MKKETLNQTIEKYHKETNENVNSVFYGHKIVDGKITNELGLIFLVKKKKPKSKLKNDEILPSIVDIDGEEIKTDVLETTPKLAATFHYCDQDFYTWQTTPPINNQYKSKVIGGMGAYNIVNGLGIGTLGFVAVDNDTDSVVMITNSHVALKDPLITSERSKHLEIINHYDNIIQQGYFNTPTDIRVYNDKLGKVKKYVPLTTLDYNQVDGTAISVEFDKFSNTTSYKQIGFEHIITEPMEFATTLELDNLLTTNPDLFVSGIRTGPKGDTDIKLKPFGFNGSITTEINLLYNSQSLQKTIHFNNVQAYTAIDSTDPTLSCFFPANSGDSGSAVIANIPVGGGIYKMKIIGLLFAVSFVNNLGIIAYFNRIDDVAEQLNIRALDATFLNTITVSNFSNSDNLDSCVIEGLSDQKYIIKEGKKYWQVGLTDSTNYCNI